MHMKIIFININVIVKRESNMHANLGGSTSQTYDMHILPKI